MLGFIANRKSVSLKEVCAEFSVSLDEIELLMFELEKQNEIRIENSTCAGNCGSCDGCDSQNASIDPISLSSVVVVAK